MFLIVFAVAVGASTTVVSIGISKVADAGDGAISAASVLVVPWLGMFFFWNWLDESHPAFLKQWGQEISIAMPMAIAAALAMAFAYHMFGGWYEDLAGDTIAMLLLTSIAYGIAWAVTYASAWFLSGGPSDTLMATFPGDSNVFAYNYMAIAYGKESLWLQAVSAATAGITTAVWAGMKRPGRVAVTRVKDDN